MKDLKGKRVLVMGLGVHGGGLGVARWLVKQGAQVTVTDLKTAGDLDSSLRALRGQPIRFVLGEHRDEDFLTSDLIVRNPGVPRESRFLKLAEERGIPIEMEMGLLVERLPRGSAQVTGITGTKGKTTTTLMAGAILAKANLKTVVAGNLRVSALCLLDQIDAATRVVLELSSWQLEGLVPHQTSPHVAAITNISPDHLNRYRDFDDYASSKATIFRYQQPGDFIVLNLDSPPVTRLAARACSRIVWTSSTRALNEGAFREGNALIWQWEGERTEVLDIREMRLKGEHSVANALVAMALAVLNGATPNQVAEGLTAFSGVEHRQEFIREFHGVQYVDDTTATTPAATAAALEALAPQARALVLIAGGADKNLEFEDVAREMARRAQHILLLEGTATDKIERALRKVGASNLEGRFSSLEEAVAAAASLARPGDLVLLSPGCASFGMFANEFERGDRFKSIVEQLGT